MNNKIDTTHWIDQKEISHYLHEVRKHQPLTRLEEHLLLKEIRAGKPGSKEKLIYSNLRFVISIAKKYQNNGLSLSDLISEGNLGLLKAAERFNYDQDEVRFLSYAVWWVKQTIIQSLNDNSRVIRLPINVINDVRKMNREMTLNLTEEKQAMGNHKYSNLPSVDNLDNKYDEDGLSIYDKTEDVTSLRPDDIYDNEQANLNHALNKVLLELSETERMVISRYFGLDCDESTLQDISVDLNITKERVRQIKEKAIKKIRFYSSSIFELL